MYSSAFFEVCAQLIPVLFLALVLEERFRDEEEGARERIIHTWVVALLVAAEIAALTVVATAPDDTSGFGIFVSVVLLFAGFLMVMPVVGSELRLDRSRVEKIGHAAAGLFVIVTVLGTSVAMYL